MGIVLISAYFASLSPLALFRALPGSIAQGLIWGLLALGVYITYKLLDFADLSVDGSFATGGAVAVMLIRSDMNPWVSLIFAFAAGMLAGMVTGLLHTKLGIPPILAGILTQIALYSINLNIMGQSNQAISVDKYSLAVSLRYVSGDTAAKIKVFTTCILFGVVIVAILYWYFGTEQGHSIRATGCNPQMARAQGINTSFCKVLALMISNGLVGLSGALYAQYQGAADVNMGRGAIVSLDRQHFSGHRYTAQRPCRRADSPTVYCQRGRSGRKSASHPQPGSGRRFPERWRGCSSNY